MSIDRFRFKEDYPTLSIISTLLKGIGILFLVFAFIGFIYGIVLLNSEDYLSVMEDAQSMSGYYLISSAIVIASIITVPFLAFAELIKLFVRIEFNTRRTTDDEMKIQTADERDNSIPSNSKKHGLTWEDWKAVNPDQTINDYYASLR
jgi:hypothetical protein